LRRRQQAGLAGQGKAYEQGEQRSERGHERRRDGVGSVLLRGRYQGSYRQPAAGRDEQRESEPANDQHRRRQ
jgi:hypothetical protein